LANKNNNGSLNLPLKIIKNNSFLTLPSNVRNNKEPIWEIKFKEITQKELTLKEKN